MLKFKAKRLFLLSEIWYNIHMKKQKYTEEQLNNMSREELAKLVLSQQNELAEQTSLVELLKEQIKIDRMKKYGRKSEQVIDGQICIEFNEAEASFSEKSEEPKAEEVVIPEHTRKKARPKGKLEEDLSGIVSEIVDHTLSEEELAKEFPDGYNRLPDEVHKTLEFIPAQFKVLEHHIAVYKASKGGKILRAPQPVNLLPHSIVTPSLAAAIINSKYVNSLPLYRLEQEFKRNEINLSRQTMANWMIRLTERYLSLVYDKMREKLLSSSVVHADETPVLVNKDGRKAGSKSYMWVYCSNDKDKEIVMYDYQKTRKAENPMEYLEDFKGTLVTDGYQVYHAMGKRTPDLKIAGCWAHARRPFADIVKSIKKNTNTSSPRMSIAVEAVERIGEIYEEDKKLNDIPSEMRKKLREEKVKPLVEAYFEWVKEQRLHAVKGSALGKALQYSINQESYLRTFLEEPDVPLDNNRAERAIRNFTIGRKNWVMIDTIHGAESSAMLYSLAETAKANNLKPYEYFKYLLEEIPPHMDEKDTAFIDKLMPWSDTLPEACRKEKQE